MSIARPEPPELSTNSRLRVQAPAVSVWDPPAMQQAKPAAIEIPIEQEIIDAIAQPLRNAESHRAGNDRKEGEVAALLDRLTPAQSFMLGKRLSVGARRDPLVAAFGRMVAERRIRLLSYLARRRVISAQR